MTAQQLVRITEATTTSVIPPGVRGRLDRVIVNTGDDAETAELQYADDSEVIGSVDVSVGNTGRRYDVRLGRRGLDVVTSGTADITITFDAETVGPQAPASS